MIYVRRAFAIFLAIMFVILFPVLLFVSQVNSTVGDPDFYNQQMEKADVYNFVYDEALPAALDEAESDDPSDNPIDTDAIEDEIIAVARKILTPEWIQEQFELATEQIIPYFLGESDGFTYIAGLKDKVQAAPRIIREEIIHGEAFDSIYNDLNSYAAEKIVENLDKVPYPLNLDKTEVEDSLHEVVDKEWLADRVEEAMDSIVPYMTLDSDHFTITIPLEDRVDAIADATFELINQQETYDYLFDEVIEPTIREYLEPQIALPFGVNLSEDEVAFTIEEVLPQSWLEARLEEVINASMAYIKGDSGSIDIQIDLTDRKPEALNALIELAEQKLEGMFDDLPVCGMAEFTAAMQHASVNELPNCRPTGVSYEEYKTILGIELSESVKQEILNKIPDDWLYTEIDLRESMGVENRDFLDDARNYVRDGWTFTETDLKDKLDNPDDEETLEDVRDYLGNGYTLTEQDLKDEMDENDVDSLDDARSWIDTVRTWLWGLWIIPILLLIGIGFLGGRSWKGRGLWALAVLFIASLIVVIAIAATYSNTVEPEIEEAIDLAEHEGLELVMAEKMNQILENSASDFTSGMQTDVLWFVILSGVALAAIIGWNIYQGRREKSTSIKDNLSRGTPATGE